MAKNCTTGVPARGRCTAEDGRATKQNAGLAERLRAWMRGREGREFTPAQAIQGLGLKPGPEGDPVRRAVLDFYRRGEVMRVSAGLYRFDAAWRPAPPSDEAARLYRAMYVSRSFGVSDLVRLTQDQVSVKCARKTVRRLAERGYLRPDGRQKTCQTGAERVWRIVDRDKFRIDLL